ncbi:MAG: flagellar assembly protein FliW [Dongiaceae bacterium]
MSSDPTSATSSPSGDTITIENNMGTFQFRPDQILFFPQGLVGFPDNQEFGLTNLPNPALSEFKLLQCLSEPRLSFIVLPNPIETSTFEANDIEEACTACGFKKSDTALLFIVTIRKTGEGIAMTINQRAPVLVDMVQRLARQYVLSNNKYAVQHPLN